MIHLDGKVAIVTGAGSGIGEATAELLASLGAKVVVADINPDSAARVVSQIKEKGGAAISVQCDVAVEEEVVAMVNAAVTEFGALDILHNNAAITAVEHQSRDTNVVDMDVDVWDKTNAVILRGSMLGCKHAVPVMIAHGGGSIINMASISAVAGTLILIAYSAAKAGIPALTRSVATAYGKQRIRCNTIVPGMIMTPSVANVLTDEFREIVFKNNLVPWPGEAIDVANLVAFLASDASKYITGESIRIDGGVSAHQPMYAFFQ
jgi:NAD(P)-dependent dehydrogenase (short-subunit alcohol dehydrogenase family)